ncbi:MAG: saccharopine dehydrogenase C-terminal domain-containing protein [Vicinamibacteria bacterium]
MKQGSSKPRKVIVLGSGMIGSAIAQDLAASGHEVHLADTRQESLARASSRFSVTTHVADLGKPELVTALVKGFDLAIGALPSVIGLQTVRACVEAGCNVVDISFMPEDARVLDALARERGVLAITDSGVAPGLSNMMAVYAAHQLDACERLEIAVGGLPAVRTWPFNYKAGFAPWDVLEEYTRPARVVEDGQVVIKEPMTGLELIDVPEVGTLESFITDGLRSLAETLKVPFMEERTLRWPGHAELMKIFRETGFFSLEPITVAGQTLRPRDLTAALLFPKWTFAEGEADITVMRVTAWGTKGGEARRFMFDFLDRFDPVTGLRSMSRSTGFTATAVAELILDGTVTQAGVHAPESLGLQPGVLDRVLGYLRERGIRCVSSLT